MANSPPYVICPNCQANLDPGERCDCQRAKMIDYPPQKAKEVIDSGSRESRRASGGQPANSRLSI